jgi:hypothetical protein
MDQNKHPLLSLSNRTLNNLNSPLKTVTIHSPKYKTFKGLNVQSSFGDLKRFFPVLNYQMEEAFVIVTTPYFSSARFYFQKEQLSEGWWDTVNNRFDPEKIPAELPMARFEIHW